MAIEYFNAYHSYLKSIEPLNEAERGRLFTALLEYSSTGAEPELRGNERFIFPMIRQQIDRDREKYVEKCAVQAKNANIRWHATGCQRMPTDANDAKEKEKEKEKTKENIARGGAPETAAPQPFTELPLNTGKLWPVTEDYVTELSDLYPAVDVRQQLRNMRGWLDSNPKNRKTEGGIKRFIVGWLSKEQNRAPAAPAVPEPKENGEAVILRRLEEKRSAREKTLTARLEELRHMSPEFLANEKAIRLCASKAARSQGAARTGAEMERDQLLEQRAAILQDYGRSADWLEDKPDCSICGDRGYVGTQKCQCLIRMLEDQK